MRIGILLALLAAALGMQQATPVSLTYPEKPGPGRGRHGVFLTGDEEYRGEEGLPMLVAFHWLVRPTRRRARQCARARPEGVVESLAWVFAVGP